MNIFEQYGGYEVVKQAISNYKQSGDMVTAAGLELQCLEYRRERNIFEVGDKVVEITDYPSNDVLTVKSISDNLLVCESDDLSASYVLSNKYKPYFYVRHTTDAEIKAGRRL